MGMFDTIAIHKAIVLPGYPESEPRDLQTKCLECDLLRYELRGDSKLYHVGTDSDGGSSCEPQPVEAHGYVYAYHFTKDQRWYEYRFKFTDGLLVGVETITAPTSEAKHR